MWGISAQPAEPADLDFQIADNIKNMSSDVTVWHALEREFEIDIFCGIFLKGYNEGVGVSHDTLILLADRKIKIDLDIYSLGREGGLSINELLD
jgi:hypothetical protein